jgi:hypothetical protein
MKQFLVKTWNIRYKYYSLCFFFVLLFPKIKLFSYFLYPENSNFQAFLLTFLPSFNFASSAVSTRRRHYGQFFDNSCFPLLNITTMLELLSDFSESVHAAQTYTWKAWALNCLLLVRLDGGGGRGAATGGEVWWRSATCGGETHACTHSIKSDTASFSLLSLFMLRPWCSLMASNSAMLFQKH